MTRSRTNLVQSTVDYIQSLIAHRNLQAGDQLPTIKDLSAKAGMSHSTIREALQKMAAVGQLRIEHGVGTFVARPSLQGVIQPLLDADLQGLIQSSDLLEVRQELAASTLKLALRRNAKGVRRLLQTARESLVRESIGMSTADLLDFDSQLQAHLVTLTNNSLLRTLAAGTRDLAIRALDELTFSPDIARYVAGLESVLTSVDAGDHDRAANLLATLVEILTPTAERRNFVVYYDALGTGSAGGSFFTLGQRISAILSRGTGVQSSVQLTGGGLENVRLAEAAKIGLGIAQIDVAVEAYNGTGEFDRPHTNIRAIGSLGGLELHIFTLASSGITSLRDVRGKYVGLGAFGGASEAVGRRVLERLGFVAGEDYVAKQAPFDEMMTMLVERNLDLVFFLSSTRNSSLVEFAIARELRFLPVDLSVARDLAKEHPYWQPSRIEPYSYPHQTAPVPTLRVPTVLITHNAVSSGDIYSITRVLHTDKVVRSPSSTDDLDGLPFHRGAAEYWREHL